MRLLPYNKVFQNRPHLKCSYSERSKARMTISEVEENPKPKQNFTFQKTTTMFWKHKFCIVHHKIPFRHQMRVEGPTNNRRRQSPLATQKHQITVRVPHFHRDHSLFYLLLLRTSRRAKLRRRRRDFDNLGVQERRTSSRKHTFAACEQVKWEW